MGRLLSKKIITFGVALIVIIGTVIPVFAASFFTDFEEFAEGTFAPNLDIPGVTFGPWHSHFVVKTFAGSSPEYIQGKALYGNISEPPLEIMFDEPQAHIRFDFVAIDPLQVTLMMDNNVTEVHHFSGNYSNSAHHGTVSLDGPFDQIILVTIGNMGCPGCINIDNLYFSSGEDGGPPDDRIAPGAGDANVAILYPTGESIGVYSHQSEGYIENFITVDDIPDEPPTENTIIRQEGNIMVSILTTGEIQFNLGPDAEGKTYTIIMSDIHGSNTYTSYYDPNE